MAARRKWPSFLPLASRPAPAVRHGGTGRGIGIWHGAALRTSQGRGVGQNKGKCIRVGRRTQTFFWLVYGHRPPPHSELGPPVACTRRSPCPHTHSPQRVATPTMTRLPPGAQDTHPRPQKENRGLGILPPGLYMGLGQIKHLTLIQWLSVQDNFSNS